MLDRRLFMASAGASAGLATFAFPRIVFARTNSPRRFVFIIQRGAADGLSILAPTGDPAYAAVRGDFDDTDRGAKLASFFTLHPALAETAKLYGGGQALFAHAVASPYRDRSHFDGQNVLETGGSAAYRLRDGWLNRLLGLLPQSESKALALSSTVPVSLRGVHTVASYAPTNLPSAPDDLLSRVTMLYAGDPMLHPLWEEALRTRERAGETAATAARRGAGMGALAAKMLAGESGARIAMIETGNWDTHAGQRARLAGQLRGLDEMIAAIKSGLGADWSNTLVLVATEFGRTVHPNGTGGTDHGEASLAMLLGGAVAGGQVIADWPGLKQASLYEGRDLKPTTGLDTLIAGALAQHFVLEPARVMATLFPDGRSVPLARTLIRS